ncbi:MAG: hypothetical protein PHN31_00490 [Candidatus Gracilibacteria bacterium]|nr:hypothetical protein [Candidatus Gracilibacteria bacterium]
MSKEIFETLPVISRLTQENNEEKIIFFTKDNVRELIAFKDRKDIPDDDFLIYLKEIGFDNKTIKSFLNYYTQKTDVPKEIKRLRRTLKYNNESEFDNQTNENINSQVSLISEEQKTIEKIKATMNVEYAKKYTDFVYIMGELYEFWENALDSEVQEIYEEAMIEPALGLIESYKNEKNIIEAFNGLYDGLDCSYGKAEIILANEIIRVLKKMKSPRSYLDKLIYCHDIVSEKAKLVFEDAMILPTVFLISKSENLEGIDLIKYLKAVELLTVGESNDLVNDEIIYRSNIEEIKSILS